MCQLWLPVASCPSYLGSPVYFLQVGGTSSLHSVILKRIVNHIGLGYFLTYYTDLYLKYVKFSNDIPDASCVALSDAVVVTDGEQILPCFKIKFTHKFNLQMPMS